MNHEARRCWRKFSRVMADHFCPSGMVPGCVLAFREEKRGVLQIALGLCEQLGLCRDCLKRALCEVVDSWFDTHPGRMSCVGEHPEE